jgi:hypothetical protein
LTNEPRYFLRLTWHIVKPPRGRDPAVWSGKTATRRSADLGVQSASVSHVNDDDDVEEEDDDDHNNNNNHNNHNDNDNHNKMKKKKKKKNNSNKNNNSSSRNKYGSQ